MGEVILEEATLEDMSTTDTRELPNKHETETIFMLQITDVEVKKFLTTVRYTVLNCSFELCPSSKYYKISPPLWFDSPLKDLASDAWPLGLAIVKSGIQNCVSETGFCFRHQMKRRG
jgi:hypothetical protein